LIFFTIDLGPFEFLFKMLPFLFMMSYHLHHFRSSPLNNVAQRIMKNIIIFSPYIGFADDLKHILCSFIFFISLGFLPNNSHLVLREK